jgi:hypothetical protein
MLGILGYRYYHDPLSRLTAFLVDDRYDAFADTPVFSHSVFSNACLEKTNKFIYVDRPFDEWIVSFEDAGLHKNIVRYNATPDDKLWDDNERIDKIAYMETFGPEYSRDIVLQKYNYHKEQIYTLIPADQLLVYKFEQGWEPMCKFLNKNIPNVEIPWINKNKICEPVNLPIDFP